MTTFHNPYHFVPVVAGARKEDLPRRKFDAGELGAATHDRYVENTWSGRVECSLRTETPIFIGASRPDKPEHGLRLVPGFELDGRPALPASSLRGLISGIAEAASNSALRVLGNGSGHAYSYRKPMEKSLSAIGMVLAPPDTGRDGPFWLLPLSLPTLRVPEYQAVRVEERWRKLFPRPFLRVYFGRRDEIKERSFRFRTYMDTPAGRRLYGLELGDCRWVNDREIDGSMSFHRKGLFVIGEIPLGKPTPVELNAQNFRNYTQGIVRVLGCWDHRQIVETKKHEIFLRYPEDDELTTWPRIPIAERALERFYDIADERTDSIKPDKRDVAPLPYEPKDTRPGRAVSGPLTLKQGDLVYFDIDAAGTQATEISFSAIWRGRVEKRDRTGANAHVFFAGVDSELVPFNPRRNYVTVAEQVFGFVENESDEKQKARALASRVRFSHALPPADVQRLPAVPLKILSTPKPPSPALYFRKKAGGGYIAKSELNPEDHAPQGRKFYLHQPSANEPWRTRSAEPDPDQQVQVQPLPPKAEFLFHVDFDNLTDFELGMLLYALRPTAAFRHKLGMGKSIGLGSVAIDIGKLLLIDRKGRYTEDGFEAPRYLQQTPARVLEAAGKFRAGMHPSIRTALELLGDPARVVAPVHTPLVENQNAEQETYRWFVANDVGTHNRNEKIAFAHKQLPPVGPELPVLERLRWIRTPDLGP